MAVTDQTVHLKKKFRKQNRLVSLSYRWIGPKFLTLDEILRSYSQKTVFQFIALKKFPQKTQNFWDGCCQAPRFFWFFFLCSLKLYIPRENEWKFCPPIHTLGHSGVWGLIQPLPPHGLLESPPGLGSIGLNDYLKQKHIYLLWW